MADIVEPAKYAQLIREIDEVVSKLAEEICKQREGRILERLEAILPKTKDTQDIKPT